LLVTQWGCWNTYFVNPKQDTMANAFLFQAHGAAAVLGATALTDVGVLSGLGNVFFKQLGQSATLGEALQAAQRIYLNQNPAAASKLRGFALLGDPAAEVR
ncbi:MAG: C25 family cysteine peptidase, partial [Candidatus Contendobacter sp.]|nr:C25 family cysteine peptidase [Candidatus Contendobacter sp.]